MNTFDIRQLVFMRLNSSRLSALTLLLAELCYSTKLLVEIRYRRSVILLVEYLGSHLNEPLRFFMNGMLGRFC